MNHIQNPGFEELWDGNHECHVFPKDGDSYFTEIGNILTPEKWTFYFKHDPGTWDQPEARDAWLQHDSHRVQSGQKAFMYFTFFRRHDAGLYQRVEVGRGSKLNLSAYCHAWSNHNLEGYEWCNCNGRCSCGVGTDEVLLTDSEIPPLNGDPWNDAIGNFKFLVGIDPNGGTDPFSSDVVWSEPVSIYNTHHEISVGEVIAASNTVTVFLRSTTLWAFRNNDAYWDSVELKVETTEQRGAPRVQYDRTYVLVPPGAPSAMVEAISRGTWDTYRCTVGGSADDAGIGDLDYRRVVAINPQEWGDDLEEFYKEHYKGISYIPLDASIDNVGKRLRDILDPNPTPPTPSILLGQCDNPWGSIRYAGGRCSTICAMGCWITDCAMALRYYGIDPDATPDKVDAAIGSAGYGGGCGMLWSAMPTLGLRVVKSTTSNAEAHAHLDKGEVCFAEVLPSILQHFVLITRHEDGRYWMFDPWQRAEGWLDEAYTGVESWRLIEPYTEPAPPPPPPPTNTNGHIGLHLQTMTGGWDTFTHTVKPPVMKVLASMQDVSGIKRQCIDTAVVWRHVTNAYGDTLEHPDPMTGAVIWVDKFRDSLYEVCTQLYHEFPGLEEPYFYVESVNECMPSLNAAHVIRNVNFDMAFIDALAETGLPIKPAVFCAAVGNPHESEYDLLVPLARKAMNTDSLMAYHNYWFANPNESGLESWWKYHAGRWAEMDKVFVQNGIYVRWYGGESGAVGSATGHHLLPNDGWKHSTCYGGDWNRYLTDILKMNQMISDWNETHGNRYLGSVLFTTGEPYCGWPWFQIQGDETRDLAERLV